MGLLDALGSDQGLLGLALLSAASPKPVRTGLGEGLLGGLQLVQQQRAQREDREQRRLMMEMQRQQMQRGLDDRKRQQELMSKRDQFLASIDPNQGPPMEATLPGAMRAGLDPREFAMLSPQQADPMAGFDKINPKDYTPESLQQFMQTRNPAVLRAAQKPTDWNQQIVVGPDGKPMVNQLLLDAKRQIARDGAARVVQSVNTEKPLLNTVAQGLGKQIDDSLAAARSATSAINTAQTLRAAVDSGKIVSGPGATFRVLGLQVGQMLGVGGKDGAEILANTRTAIKSMAQAELDAAQQMRGQGQITESERDIIRRAAAGSIDELTAPEIRLLSEAMEKTARFKIGQHKSNVKNLGSMSGAQALMPFYQVDEPPPYKPPGAIDLGGGFRVKP